VPLRARLGFDRRMAGNQVSAGLSDLPRYPST